MGHQQNQKGKTVAKDFRALPRMLADKAAAIGQVKQGPVTKQIHLPQEITVPELGRTLNITSADVLEKLKVLGMTANINTKLDHPTAAMVAVRFGFEVDGFEEDDEEGLVPSVTRILNAERGYTLEEIAAKLQSSGFSIGPIGEAVRRLVIEGKVSDFRLPGKNINVYTLKSGGNMAAQAQPVSSARKFNSEPTLLGANPAGIIDLREGINVCIWKVVSDRKRRTQTDIIEILATYGINREVAKNAFIHLKASKNWFDCTGTGTAASVRLKRDIKMPEPVPTDPEQLKQKMTPGAIRVGSERVATEESGKVNSTTTIRERTEVQPQQNMPVAKSTNVIPLAAVQAALPIEETDPVEKARQAVADEVAAMRAAQQVIRHEDGLTLSIWKAMSDYRPYLAAEVGLLLEAVGFNPATVATKIGTLYSRGWFSRTPVPGKRSFTYVLSRDIPMPEADVAPQKTTVKVEDKPQEEPVVNAPAPTSDPAPAAAVAAPAASQPAVDNGKVPDGANKASVPLVRCVVELKGIPFTFAEANEIATDLMGGGYDQPAEAGDGMSSLFEVSIKIKGEPFNDAELREVAKELISNGFGQTIPTADNQGNGAPSAGQHGRGAVRRHY